MDTNAIGEKFPDDATTGEYHKCPKCGGLGRTIRVYPAPAADADAGRWWKQRIENIRCPLCEGRKRVMQKEAIGNSQEEDIGEERGYATK